MEYQSHIMRRWYLFFWPTCSDKLHLIHVLQCALPDVGEPYNWHCIAIGAFGTPGAIVGKPYKWHCPLEGQCRCHVAHPQTSLAHSCARDVARTYNITTHHHKYVVTCSSLWASPAACTEMPSARGRQALPVALHTHAPASRPDMQHPYKLERGRQALPLG